MSRRVEHVYEGVILEMEFKLGKEGIENLMVGEYKVVRPMIWISWGSQSIVWSLGKRKAEKIMGCN